MLMKKQIAKNLQDTQYPYRKTQFNKQKTIFSKHQTFFSVLNITWILKILLIINYLNIYPFVLSLSSVPLDQVKLGNIQSFTYDCIISNPSTTLSSSYNVQYNNPRRTNVPVSIVYGIYEFKYDINFKHSSDNKYHLDFMLDSSSITNSSFLFNVFSPDGTLQIIKVSFLIWFTGFRYSSKFQLHQLIFSSNGILSGSSGNPTYSQTASLGFNYNDSIILPFLKHCQIKSTDGKFRLYESHSQGASTNILSAEMKFQSNGFYNISLTMNYLVIDYITLNKKSNQFFQFYHFYDKSLSPSLSMPYTNYSDSYSYKLFGLVYFQYNAKNNGQNMFDFQFTSSDLNDSFSFTIDDDFNKLTFSLLVITFRLCRDPQYPIVWMNTTLGKEQCLDFCVDGYYMGFSANMHNCNACDQECETCDQPNQCIRCKIYYDTNLSGACILKKNYFFDPSNNSIIRACSFNSNLSNCLQCQINGYFCEVCNLGYYINSNNLCSSCDSLFSNCIKCTNLQCLQCSSPLSLLNSSSCGVINSNSSVVSNSTQKPCQDPRCLFCFQSALNICLLCNDTNLTIINGRCVQNCGDGIIYGNQTCDDGNNLDYDGCSADCSQIENGYTCLNLPSSPNIQTCVYIGPINLRPVSITKEKRSNKIKIVLKNSVPNLLVWQKFDKNSLKTILQLKVPKFQLNPNAYSFDYQVSFISYSPNGPTRLLQTAVFTPSLYQYLLVQIFYLSSSNEAFSFNNLLLEIFFHPSLANVSTFYVNSSFFTPSSSVQLTLQSEDNSLIQYFSQDYYENCSKIEGFSLIISILTIIMILIAIVAQFLQGINAKQMIITIQTTCVVQFSYFSLLGIGPLNPMFAAMAQGLKYTSGFDINLSSTKTKIKQLIAMNIQSTNIEGNVNVSVIIPLIFVFVGLILLLIKRLKGNKRTIQKQNYENIEIIQNKEQPQSQQVVQKSQSSQSILDKPQNLISNFGFFLFIFFLYKYLIFILIQVTQNMEQLQFTGMVILGLIAFLTLFFIFTLFIKFQFYQNTAQKISYIKPSSSLSKNKQALLKIYFLLYIFERIVNSFSVTILTKLFVFNGFIPSLIYILKIIFIYRYLQRIYHPSNKLRLYLTYSIGIIISVLLGTRRFLLKGIIDIQGGEQLSYGIYLPYTILPLLFILLVLGIIFQIYSIKRIRCCQLEIQQYKVKQNQYESSKSRKHRNLQQEHIKQGNHQNFILGQKIEIKIINQQDKPLSSKNMLNFTPKTNDDNYKSTDINISQNLKGQAIQIIQNIIKNNQPTLSNQNPPYNNKSSPKTNKNSLKKQIKTQLQRLRLGNQNQQSFHNKNYQIKQKFIVQDQHKEQQIQSPNASYSNSNKHLDFIYQQNSNYKYTNQKKYYYQDQFDMI